MIKYIILIKYKKKKKFIPLRTNDTLKFHIILLKYKKTKHTQTLHNLFFFTLHLHHLNPKKILNNFLTLQTKTLKLNQIIQNPNNIQIFHTHLN